MNLKKNPQLSQSMQDKKWQNSTNLEDKKYPTNREQKETTLLAKWCSDKESVCQCSRHTRVGFYSWVGNIPWRKKPTPVFLPEKSH